MRSVRAISSANAEALRGSPILAFPPQETSASFPCQEAASSRSSWLSVHVAGGVSIVAVCPVSATMPGRDPTPGNQPLASGHVPKRRQDALPQDGRQMPGHGIGQARNRGEVLAPQRSVRQHLSDEPTGVGR